MAESGRIQESGNISNVGGEICNVSFFTFFRLDLRRNEKEIAEGTRLSRALFLVKTASSIMAKGVIAEREMDHQGRHKGTRLARETRMRDRRPSTSTAHNGLRLRALLDEGGVTDPVRLSPGCALKPIQNAAVAAAAQYAAEEEHCGTAYRAALLFGGTVYHYHFVR